MFSWEVNNVKNFIDDLGTEFIKGPFEFEDYKYDYKLKDEYGEDYCTAQQMRIWGVQMVKNLNYEK